jgi:hypothetical protein
MKDILVRKSASAFILFVLIGVAVIPLTSTTIRGNDSPGSSTEQLTYTFSFAPPIVGAIQSAGETFTKIDTPGCLALGSQPGYPTLPVKFIQLLLPPQETVDTVTVTGLPVELRHSGTDVARQRVYPYQQEVPIGSDAPTNVALNVEVYNSHNLYPALPYGEYHVGYSHGYAVFSMALQPVQLIPADGRLFYYPELKVTVSLHKIGYVNSYFRGTPEDEAWVKSLVSNPEVTVQYPGLAKAGYPGGLCDPSDHYDYVIVTTTANGLDHWEIGGTLTYNWTSLMNQHMSEGLSCTLVTVQDINACPDYWNSSYYPLFNDSQAHIREFCRDAYEDWGTSYVLIAGDADTIPARQLYYEYEGGVDSDLYWSNLDNSFNADHDNQWGEEGDNGFDTYSELFIGRVTCDTPQDVSNWLTKSLYYATSCDADYLENCGFYEGNSGWGGKGGAMIDYAAINGTNHWFFGFLYGFTTWNAVNPTNAFNLSVRWTTGSPPSPGWTYNPNAWVGFQDAINNDSVTLITGVGHADSQMSLDVYDSDWQTLYHNTKPFFICDMGSHCGDFDAGDGILDTMLFHSNTSLAFGCLYNTGYGWGSFDDLANSSDLALTKLFWDYYLDIANNSQSTSNWQLGKGLAWAKDTMAPSLNWSYLGGWRGTIEDRLLFADPAQLLKTPHEQNHPPYISWLQWNPNIGLEVSATDPDGFFETVYIQIDWGDGTVTDWLGPYHSDEYVTLTHEWATPGGYIVKARAKDVHEAVSDWTAITVHIPDTSLAISIRGGLGITAKITNTGDEDINLTSSGITLTGGFIMFDHSFSGMPAVLRAGKSMWDKEFLGGFGNITICVNVTCADGMTVQKNATGFLFGVFVFGMK